MNRHGLHWLRSGLFAGALFAAQQTTPAFATQTHKLQHGETLSQVARRYGVAVKDIAQASHLANPDSIADGTRLTIPDPPKRHRVAATMSRTAQVSTDAASVRMGPDSSYRRKTTVFCGETVTVTARQDGWSQVQTAGGLTGWVRSDFLHTGKHSAAPMQASVPVKSSRKHVRHYAPAMEADRKRHLARRAAQGRQTETAQRTSEKWRSYKKRTQVARAERRRVEKVRLAKIRKAHNWKVAKSTGKHRWQVATSRNAVHYTGKHGRHYMPEAVAPSASNDLVRTAYSYRGTPYRWGGASRGGFDCSGFTEYLYRQKGVSLPHSAKAQFRSGQHVDRKSLKAGDLVFFHTVTPGISHVGMYVGDGKFVHSSSRRSGGVRVDSLNSGYYSRAFRGATRIKKK